MKSMSAAQRFVHFESIMDDALAGFELDCRQARRGFKVSMAVKVFGVGTLLPNHLAGDERGVSQLNHWNQR